jgi:hypothetical protein
LLLGIRNGIELSVAAAMEDSYAEFASCYTKIAGNVFVWISVH